MKIKVILILFLIVLVSSQYIYAQRERFVIPVDQAAKDSSFKRFRDRLLQTLEVKNKRRLAAVIAKDIKLSFGGAEGIRDFNRIWKPNDPKSKIWNELNTILKNGGTFYSETKTKTFCAPSLQ